MVAGPEVAVIIDLHGDQYSAPGANVELQAGIGLPTMCQDEHYGPIGTAEDPGKGLFIRLAWLRDGSGMGMGPNPAYLIGLKPGIDLPVEEVGHRLVVKSDGGHVARLADKLDVLDVEQVVDCGDAKAADLGIAQVAQKSSLAQAVGLSRRQGELGDASRSTTRSLLAALPGKAGHFARGFVGRIIFGFLGVEFLVTVRTHAVLATVRTKVFAANGAGFQAIGTEVAATASARPQAVGAIRVVAAAATRRTGVTEGRTAAVAVAAIIVVDARTTVRARGSIPGVEFHVGAAAAVGVQQPVHQQEEIMEPAFGQGGGDRGTTVALTELLVLDVGMRNIVTTGRWVRIKGHDPIGLRTVADVSPCEPDLEVAEQDAIEFDGVRGDHQLVRLEVNFNFLEFAFQGTQIQIDRRHARGEPGLRSPCQATQGLFQFTLKTPAGVGQITEERLGGKMPAPLPCAGDVAIDLFDTVPVILGQVDGIRRRPLPRQLFLDYNGCTKQFFVNHGHQIHREGLGPKMPAGPGGKHPAPAGLVGMERSPRTKS